jgi:hypothetical protein
VSTGRGLEQAPTRTSKSTARPRWKNFIESGDLTEGRSSAAIDFESGRRRLAAALPHRLPHSNNKLLPLEKALAFRHG